MSFDSRFQRPVVVTNLTRRHEREMSWIEPLPVVKMIRLQPEATWPAMLSSVVAGAVHEVVSPAASCARP